MNVSDEKKRNRSCIHQLSPTLNAGIQQQYETPRNNNTYCKFYIFEKDFWLNDAECEQFP